MIRLSRPTLIALAFFIVLDSLAFYAAYVKHKAERAPIALSALAPDITWKDFDGRKHKLKDASGRPVVLHFWASWCPPCRDEFPQMIRAAIDNPDIVFLTVSSDDERAKAMQFIKMVPDVSGLKAPANMLYAWDPSKTITYDQFLTTRYPETIFVDSTGRMRRKYAAPVDWDSKEVRAYLKELKVEQ